MDGWMRLIFSSFCSRPLGILRTKDENNFRFDRDTRFSLVSQRSGDMLSTNILSLGPYVCQFLLSADSARRNGNTKRNNMCP